MRRLGSSLLATIILACCTIAHAASTPSFTVTATDVTLPSSNSTSTTTFTLTSVNGYTGVFVLSCEYSGPQTSAHLPFCGGGVARAYTLKANQSVKGDLPVTPFPVPTARQSPGHSLPNRAPVFAFAIATLVFLRPRFRRGGWFAMSLLATAIVTSMASCGGGARTLPYAVTAVDTNTQAQVSTNFTITIQ